MGTVYRDGVQLKRVLEELARRMFGEGENRDRFVALGVSVKFSIRDPECVIILDPRDPQVVRPDVDGPAEITISMTADFMHDFWMGKVNIIKSLEAGEMAIEADPHLPAVKVVDLLPLLLPGLDIYPSLL